MSETDIVPSSGRFNETAVSETDIVPSSDDDVVFRQESSAGAIFC